MGSDDNDEGVNVSVDDQKSDVNEQKDEELEASEESGNRADLDKNIMEENDNEDMQSNAVESDCYDNEFDASDDDEISDVTRFTEMKPFNIEEDLCPITKEHFIGKSDINSHLFENDEDEKVVDFFGDIFGLHDIYSDSGYQISDKEAQGLYQYFIDLNEDTVIKISSLKIELEDKCIKQLFDKETNMFMTASVLNIMVDGLNRYVMKKRDTEYPEVYVMQSYQIQRLKKIKGMKKFMKEKDMNMENFEKCLKHFIVGCQFKNNIFAIMHKYKEAGQKLKHLVGTIFVSNPGHFVHITIDLEKKFILTRDPLGVNEAMQSSVNNIRQVVAKAIGIGYQIVMDDKEEEEVYFGDADMQSKFVEREVNKLKKDKNITASSFNHMNSPTHKYPQQTDGHNCGVLALWYNLFYLKDKGYIVDDSTTTLAKSKINVRSIRHQMLLYLFCMKFYFSNLEKIDKDKSMLRNVIELGKSEFGEELNNILEDIFLTNVEKKGNDDQEKKDNECEEDKESCYLNDAIKEFISEMCISTIDKKAGNKRTLTTRSLY